MAFGHELFKLSSTDVEDIPDLIRDPFYVSIVSQFFAGGIMGLISSMMERARINYLCSPPIEVKSLTDEELVDKFEELSVSVGNKQVLGDGDRAIWRRIAQDRERLRKEIFFRMREKVRKRALKKLTPKEQEALGVSEIRTEE